jgi:hypothetical protein
MSWKLLLLLGSLLLLAFVGWGAWLLRRNVTRSLARLAEVELALIPALAQECRATVRERLKVDLDPGDPTSTARRLDELVLSGRLRPLFRAGGYEMRYAECVGAFLGAVRHHTHGVLHPKRPPSPGPFPHKLRGGRGDEHGQGGAPGRPPEPRPHPGSQDSPTLPQNCWGRVERRSRSRSCSCVRDSRPQGRDPAGGEQQYRSPGPRRLGSVRHSCIVPYGARSPTRSAAKGHARTRRIRRRRIPPPPCQNTPDPLNFPACC